MRKVGIREFRDRATKLLAGDEVLAVERHGTLVGYYVPVRLGAEQGMRAAQERLQRELEECAEDPAALLRRHRDAILALAQKHGARSVRVFGSVARGESTPSSDLDLLVEFEKGRSLLDLSGLIVDLEQLLGRRVDVTTPGGLRDYMRDAVIEEAVPV